MDIRYGRKNNKLAKSGYMMYVVMSVFILMNLLSCSSEPAKSRELELSPGIVKKVRGSEGTITYRDNSKGAFSGKIEIQGLDEGSYLLTLHENGQFPVEDELPGWRKWGSEQYLDFKQIHIDASGTYQGDIEVDLPPGKYTFKFFVKKVGGNFSSVLYNAFLKVRVQ